MLRKVRVEAFFCVDDGLKHWTFECVISSVRTSAEHEVDLDCMDFSSGEMKIYAFPEMLFIRTGKLFHRLCTAAFRCDRNSRLKQVLAVFGKRATFRLFTSLICKNITKLWHEKKKDFPVDYVCFKFTALRDMKSSEEFNVTISIHHDKFRKSYWRLGENTRLSPTRTREDTLFSLTKQLEAMLTLSLFHLTPWTMAK